MTRVMKTSLFTNSKNALMFAGSIIVGTIVLVDSNSGDDVLTASARDDNSGNDSYRRLMDRKYASRHKSQEARGGSFAPDEGFEDLGDPENDIEIGDYAPPQRAEQQPTEIDSLYRPGADGPGT